MLCSLSAVSIALIFSNLESTYNEQSNIGKHFVESAGDLSIILKSTPLMESICS